MTFDVHQVKILKMLPDQVNSMCSSSPKVLMQTLNAKSLSNMRKLVSRGKREVFLDIFLQAASLHLW